MDLNETVPGKLADQKTISLEHEYEKWDTSAREIYVDEAIIGNVLRSGQVQNPAWQAMIRTGITKETPVFLP